MIKRLARLIIKEVHPDFFGSRPTQQAVNKASMQSLQEQLSAKQTHVDLEFYAKNRPDRRVTMPALNSKILTNEELMSLRLMRLGRDIGIKIDEDEMQQLESRLNTCQKDPLTSHREKLLKQRVTFINSLKNISVPSDTKLRSNMAWLRKNTAIYYDQSLTKEERARAFLKLAENIQTLNLCRWCHLPLMIRTDFGREAKGFVEIPYDFRIAELIAFLEQHLPSIEQEFRDEQKRVL